MSRTTANELRAEIDAGDLAPDFVARDSNGKEVNLKTLIGGRNSLLIFYRGGWCPYCNQQLANIAQDYSKFKDLNVTIVAVSSEELEKGRELLQKLKLPYTILSDARFEGIDKYGVRDSNPSEKTRARGITQLSKPSSFIIDKDGIVRYRHVGMNASDRPKNEDLLRALAGLEGNDPATNSGMDACTI